MTDEQVKLNVLITATLNLDNFGDLLFALITKQYFSDSSVTFGGPFDWSVDGLLDQKVHAYGPLLDTERFDVVWTAGGEMGQDLEGAFIGSAPGDIYDRYLNAHTKERKQIIDQSVGGAPIVSPYIPSLISHPLNAGTISVLNSVGISALLGYGSKHAPPTLREAYLELVKSTSLISVRDKNSSEILTLLGIEHRLAPDAVHTISKFIPKEKNAPGNDIAILQTNGAILLRYGIPAVADALIKSTKLRDFRIRILLTANFRSAASMDLSKEFIKHVKMQVPSIEIALVEDRDPATLVEHIKCSQITIGTSLHLRIVASSYGIPRVSFTGEKVTHYAKTWDYDMPYDVTLDRLDKAIEEALDKEKQDREKSANLTRLAHENIKLLTSQVIESAHNETSVDNLARMRERRKLHYEELKNLTGLLPK